jgi:hypothetical protein
METLGCATNKEHKLTLFMAKNLETMAGNLCGKIQYPYKWKKKTKKPSPGRQWSISRSHAQISWREFVP